MSLSSSVSVVVVQIVLFFAIIVIYIGCCLANTNWDSEREFLPLWGIIFRYFCPLILLLLFAWLLLLPLRCWCSRCCCSSCCFCCISCYSNRLAVVVAVVIFQIFKVVPFTFTSSIVVLLFVVVDICECVCVCAARLFAFIFVLFEGGKVRYIDMCAFTCFC